MSLLSQAYQNKRERESRSMYSPQGAAFQEDCLHIVGSDKSFSAFIGQLVTAINTGEITVDKARKLFNDAWYKAHC